ncbi:hypothetical protein CLU79DRAFT_839825 [Phycomyces nitens]|nr:hypothetical protein CLU79DRAFT_839825 [Phycomyces nitens]
MPGFTTTHLSATGRKKVANTNSKFLPPYSPFLIPVKECFSKLNNFVEKHPLDSEETLCERIKSSNYELTKQNCKDWETGHPESDPLTVNTPHEAD